MNQNDLPLLPLKRSMLTDNTTDTDSKYILTDIAIRLLFRLTITTNNILINNLDPCY